MAARVEPSARPVRRRTHHSTASTPSAAITVRSQPSNRARLQEAPRLEGDGGPWFRLRSDLDYGGPAQAARDLVLAAAVHHGGAEAPDGVTSSKVAGGGRPRTMLYWRYKGSTGRTKEIVLAHRFDHLIVDLSAPFRLA